MRIAHTTRVLVASLAILLGHPLLVSGAEPGEAGAARSPARRALFATDVLQRAVDGKGDRLAASTLGGEARVRPLQSQGAPQRHWAARHPKLFGGLFGFGVGFIIGAAGGDDGVFNDLSGFGAGVLLGGLGVGVGVAVGLLFE